jgi:hypothetical protein
MGAASHRELCHDPVLSDGHRIDEVDKLSDIAQPRP